MFRYLIDNKTYYYFGMCIAPQYLRANFGHTNK